MKRETCGCYVLLNILCNKVLLDCTIYILTYSREQSPSWEANRFSANQEIPRILWNPKVHYHIHKCPSPALSWARPIQFCPHTSHFLKIHPNIIIPSTPGSPQWTLSLRFPHQNPVHVSSLTRTRYMPRPSNSSLFYDPLSCPSFVASVVPKYQSRSEALSVNIS